MTKVYLALYKGKKDIKKPKHVLFRAVDELIRWVTHSPYSHCEIAINIGNDRYECYSSSYRDGGVRKKTMRLPSDKWDLMPIQSNPVTILDYFKQTQGKAYDLIGVLGLVFRLQHHQTKYFCSEWCYNAITGDDTGYRFSPACLHELIITGELK